MARMLFVARARDDDHIRPISRKPCRIGSFTNHTNARLDLNLPVHIQKHARAAGAPCKEGKRLAMLKVCRCGALATELSAGTDRHWRGFAPSPSSRRPWHSLRAL